jgi:AsmA protein
MSKQLRLVVALVLGLPLLALAALYLLVDPQKFTPLLVSKLNAALERKTTIDKLELQLFPPSFRASNLTISDDPAFSKTSFLKAKSLEVRPSILPLLTGQLDIQSLLIHSPEIELIQNSAGVWNYASLGGKSQSEKPNTLKLSRLVLEDATLGLTRAPEPREEYTKLSAEVRDYAEGKPFSLKLAALMPNGKTIAGEGRITTAGEKTTLDNIALSLASLKGTLTGEFSPAAMNLQLNIPKSPIADAAPLFLPAGVNVKGDIVAAITATGTPKKPALKGRLDISGFEVSGNGIKQAVRTPKLGLALTPERITLEPASITSGATQLQTYGVISHYDSSPILEATLIAPNAQIPELLAIARAYGMSAVEGIEATGQANLQVRAHGPLTGKTPLSFAGNGALRNASLKLPSLTQPLTIATTDFRFEANSAALSNIDAKLGSSNLTGACKISNFSRPVLDFNLASDRLMVDELRTLVKEEPSNSGPSKLTATGALKVATLQLAELTLTNLTAQANYRDGHLVLNPLNASLYGGRHSGSMDIDLRPAKPLYSMNSKLEHIESSLLLAAATSLKGIVSGPFNANLDLNFSPADPMHLAQTLNGKLSLNFSQGRIASFNLTNELAAVARFMGFNGGGEKFTQFVGLTGDLDINNGKASTQNLKLNLSNLTAALTGNMNLADQTLDLKLLSILDKRFSDQVGGNKIGGFMTAALANASGNLMIPATIRGTFAKPVISPDPGEIARLKMQSFNPKDPKQMMESVGSVLDMFKKKKP